MKKKYFIYAILPTAGLALLAAGIVSANGFFGFSGNLSPDEIASRQQAMFQQESQILGISPDQVKAAWAEGKTMKQIMDDNGISQDQVQQRINDMRTSQLKSQLQTLVDKGVITQAQADQRLATMQNLFQNQEGKGARGMHGGFWGLPF
jgi:DNA-binding CsgD family transcriptional regulator